MRRCHMRDRKFDVMLDLVVPVTGVLIVVFLIVVIIRLVECV